MNPLILLDILKQSDASAYYALLKKLSVKEIGEGDPKVTKGRVGHLGEDI